MRLMDLFKDINKEEEEEDIIIKALKPLKKEFRSFKVNMQGYDGKYTIEINGKEAIVFKYSNNGIYISSAYVPRELRGNGFYRSFLTKLTTRVIDSKINSITLLGVRPYHCLFYKQLGFIIYLNDSNNSLINDTATINAYYGYDAKKFQDIDFDVIAKRCLNYVYVQDKDINNEILNEIARYKAVSTLVVDAASKIVSRRKIN